MATTRGCLGSVLLGPTPTLVAEVTAWNFDETAEQIDASAMGDCTKKFEAGAVQTTGTIDMWWDGADGGQDLFVIGAAVDIVLRTETGTGLPEFTGNATITGNSVTSSIDGIISKSITFGVNGAMTEGVQA